MLPCEPASGPCVARIGLITSSWGMVRMDHDMANGQANGVPAPQTSGQPAPASIPAIPSGTRPMVQPSDQFRQVEQLTLLGGCIFRDTGWLACFQKQGPPPTPSCPSRQQGGPRPATLCAPDPAIQATLSPQRRRPVTKSAAAVENPPASLDPLLPLPIWCLAFQSVNPTPSPRSAICAGHKTAMSTLNKH